jgi:hypothetical protein
MIAKSDFMDQVATAYMQAAVTRSSIRDFEDLATTAYKIADIMYKERCKVQEAEFAAFRNLAEVRAKHEKGAA